MGSGDVFGAVVSATDVENAVIQTLQYWFETYLQQRELERGEQRGSIERPFTWRTTNEFNDKNPEDSPPFIAVVSNGLTREPLRAGDGSVRACWGIGIGIILAASTREASLSLVKDYYIPTIRRILVQKQSLREWPNGEAFAYGVDWIDEGYDDVTFDEADRSLGQGQLMFEVEVDQVVDRFGGPNAPADPVHQPGSNWPEAQTGSVQVRKEE